jgi:hypothetical protein
VKKPAQCRFFRFQGQEVLRTACFVDGYNLFYGLLANSPYKWLDLPSLLAHILHVEDPANTLHGISFFTSGVKPALATRGIASQHAQDTYIRALKAKGVEVRPCPYFWDRVGDFAGRLPSRSSDMW